MVEFINSLRALTIETLLGLYETAVDNRRQHDEDSNEWEFHKKYELALYMEIWHRKKDRGVLAVGPFAA